MPTDPNIILSYKQPQIEMPMQMMGQAMQLKNLQQQNQMGGLQQQQLGMQVANAQRLQSALSDQNSGAYVTDPNTGSKTLNPQGLVAAGGPAAVPVAEQLSKLQLEKAQLQEVMAKNAIQGAKATAGELGGLMQNPNATPADAAAIIDRAATHGSISQPKADSWKAQLAQLPQDPADPQYAPAFNNYLKQRVLEVQEGTQQMGAIFGKTVNNMGQIETVQPAPGIKGTGPVLMKVGEQEQRAAAPGVIERDLNLYNKGMVASGKPAVPATDPGFMAWRKSVNPPSYAQVLLQMQKGEGPSVAAGMAPTADGRQVPKLPDPGDEAIAESIAAGKNNFITPSIRTPHWSSINTQAALLQGGGAFAGTAGVGAKGAGLKSWEPGQPNGQFLINLDTTLYHFDLLKQMNTALRNGDVTTANTVKNKIANEMGYPEVNSFDAVKVAAGSEYAKAVAGTNLAVEDRSKMDPLLQNANGPDKMDSTIDSMQRILGGKAKGMDAQYQFDNPGHHITERMSPESLNAMNRLGVKFTELQKPGATPQAPAAPAGKYANQSMTKDAFSKMSPAARKAFTDGGGKTQ